MKNKFYAPGNKKPKKNKTKSLTVSIEDVPDFYFSRENSPKVAQTADVPYLFNKRISLIRSVFIKLLKNISLPDHNLTNRLSSLDHMR